MFKEEVERLSFDDTNIPHLTVILVFNNQTSTCLPVVMEPETRDMSWECGEGELELHGLLWPVSPLSTVKAQTKNSLYKTLACSVLCCALLPLRWHLSQNDVMHAKICNDVLTVITES